MKLPKLLTLPRAGMKSVVVIASAVAMLGASLVAEAKITAFLAAGKTCDGAASAEIKAGSPAVKVSLCVIATTEYLCGHTTKLQAADASASGRFHVTAVTYAPAFSDPNGNLTFPIPITNPARPADFGATVSRRRAQGWQAVAGNVRLSAAVRRDRSCLRHQPGTRIFRRGRG